MGVFLRVKHGHKGVVSGCRYGTLTVRLILRSKGDSHPAWDMNVYQSLFLSVGVVKECELDGILCVLV